MGWIRGLHLRREHLSSFYHLEGRDLEDDCCRGLACFVARHRAAQKWRKTDEHPVYCLGKCYAGPAARSSDSATPIIKIQSRQSIVLSRVANGGAPSLDEYIAAEGYTALHKALRLQPADLVHQIAISELRGRGGAGFPAGKKWRSVQSQPVGEKFVVANADEGDPGAYIDRFLLTDDPHAIIEAMVIAGYAVGAKHGYIYLRKEYPGAAVRLRKALEEARGAKLLGENILALGYSFDIELVIGSGSYVCGEETSLLNALEHKRPESRVRPPYPTVQGLMGKPTLITNVETLANVPWIIRQGGEAYRALGFSTSRGTKAISLNSLFRYPGLYEVEFGISLRDIVEQLGGGLVSGSVRGVIVGGPLAGIIPPHLLDTPFAFDEMRAIGGTVGHGGVVAFDEHTTITELVSHIFEFGAFESCGKCTPCRTGTRRILELLAEYPGGSQSEVEAIVDALQIASVCGMGTGLAAFASSVIRHYGLENFRCRA